MSLSLSLKAIFQDSKHPISSLSECILCIIRSYIDYKHPSSLPINELMDTYNLFMHKLIIEEYHIYSLYDNNNKMTILQAIAKKRERFTVTWNVEPHEIVICIQRAKNDKTFRDDYWYLETGVRDLR